jgi:hypothetical protein
VIEEHRQQAALPARNRTRNLRIQTQNRSGVGEEICLYGGHTEYGLSLLLEMILVFNIEQDETGVFDVDTGRGTCDDLYEFLQSRV